MIEKIKKYEVFSLDFSLYTPPNATAQSRFDTGNIVGDLACALFPNGREIPYREKNFSGMAELTREWMDEGIVRIEEIPDLNPKNLVI